MEGIPCQGKCQPVYDPPSDQDRAPRQPYPSSILVFQSRAGRKIYREEDNDADGKGEREEDGNEEVSRSLSDLKEVAEDEESEGGYGEE